MSESALDASALLAALGPQERLEGVMDRAVARCKASLPAYATVPPAEIRAGIAADLGRALGALIEQRPLTPADREGLGEIGNLRAMQGIPLEQMLQVYRFTIDEIFNELWQAADDGVLSHAQVVDLTRQMWTYADLAMAVAIDSYRARELQQAVADAHGQTALVHGLLLAPSTETEVHTLAESLVDPNASYVALRARSQRGDLRSLLLGLQQPGVLQGGAVAPHEGDVIGFALRRPSAVPADDVIVGVGPAGPIAALPHSLAIATRTLTTAEAFGITGVRSIDQLALPAIARAEHVLGDHLVSAYVLPCEPETAAGKELLDTVRTVLAHDLAVDEAAEALCVHPNTVRNRIRRFEQLTGCSLRKVDDLVSIRLALLRAELR